MMHGSDELILLIGGLGLVSIAAALVSGRVSAPLVLVFLGIGMLAGAADPQRFSFSDFRAAYAVGGVALAVILFADGLGTSREVVRQGGWPGLALATAGVLITTAIGGVVIVVLAGAKWLGAMLVASVLAPTDAAVVSTLLRGAHMRLPERVTAALELESGLNDPASIFLTTVIITAIRFPDHVTAAYVAISFAVQIAGGAALGVGGGRGLVFLLRRLPLDPALATVFALSFALALFGLAQTLGTSGFMAVYVAAIVAGNSSFAAREAVGQFFAGIAWVAQITLFLTLGLLVDPPALLPLLPIAVPATLLLLLVARPVAVFACLAPFGYRLREMTFVSWVGLRGAVPIYLSIVPVLGDPRGLRMFNAVFVAVLVSLLMQGWTIRPLARALGIAGPAAT